METSIKWLLGAILHHNHKKYENFHVIDMWLEFINTDIL